ncbi:transglutaminase-like cysteine proteinase BTLCP [Pseudomonas pohangensis]|jgi:predicted transglutaminase-like cysteine proteinase|uniref:Transglutaminase-like cysteine proteinase BTLCP n=1 Tax=Pseudomonas pohangensis TaxID=364197 RepID=A0A1H2F7V9_9PSED|nr:transglutaminase-like cysteine peptidase [Pseudomonas pohangensis]SDU03500.1 transglutaminase-like cysteine proteinase BTLCP [Pseudomonas pohangensis]
MWRKRTTADVHALWHKGRLPAVLAILLTLLAGISSLWADYNDWDFQLVLKNAEMKYGTLDILTRDKILGWEELIKQTEGLDDQQKLEAVNNFFNRQYRFVDDLSNWQQDDYWATPVEATIKGAADCEDYSIAKYFTLRRLGIPSSQLRITYVKALAYNQAHMVLTYYATPTADPLVLDNLIADIRPASQRRDLLPVYAFNAEGLYLPGKKSGDSKRLSRWQDVLKKMRAEGFAVGDG